MLSASVIPAGHSEYEVETDVMKSAVINAMLTNLDRYISLLERELCSYTFAEQVMYFQSDKLKLLCDTISLSR